MSTFKDSENVKLVEQLRISYPVLLQDNVEVAQAYMVRRTPAAYVIDTAGRTEGEAVYGVAGILRLAGVSAAGIEERARGQTTTLESGAGQLLRLSRKTGQWRTGVSHPYSASGLSGSPDAQPLVSVIISTRDRPRLLAIALRCFREQTYAARELVVVDDGEEFPADEDAVAAAGGRVITVAPGTPLGEKLNVGIRETRGQLYQKWDDDDWYASEFLEAMIAAYQELGAKSHQQHLAYVCPVLFFDMAEWELRWGSDGVSGATLLFSREMWEQSPFRPVHQPEDVWFAYDQLERGGRLLPVSASKLHLQLRHTALSAGRGHTWTHLPSGLTVEEQLQTYARAEIRLEAILPEWVLEEYRDLRHRTGVALNEKTPSSSVEALAVGAPAPDFDLRVLDGGRRSLSDWKDRRRLLVFVQPDCPQSQTVLSWLGTLKNSTSDGSTTTLVITAGKENDIRQMVNEAGLQVSVLLQDDTEVASAYKLSHTPAAYLLDASGRIASKAGRGAAEILELARGDSSINTRHSVSGMTRLERSDVILSQLMNPGQNIAARPSNARTFKHIHVRPIDCEEPLVSIILTTHNRPRFLPVALECFKHQIYPHRELIVVDDGDTFPADPAQIAALGGRLIRVDLGTPLGEKLNIGARHSHGRLFQKWDDDDWFGPRLVQRMTTKYVRKEREAGGSYVAYVQPAIFFDVRRWKLRWGEGGLTGANLLFDREAWEQCPFRPVRYADDAWFAVDQMRGGSELLPVATRRQFVIVRYGGGAANLSHAWKYWYEGATVEESMLNLRPVNSDPEQIFPEWALSAYREFRASLTETAADLEPSRDEVT